MLDVAAMTQVVADQELRGLRAHPPRPAQDGKQRRIALLELDELVDRPDALHRAHDGNELRPFDPQREIDARRLLPRGDDVVDDVDAADERDPAVDVTQLAMQAAQPVPAERPRRDFGTILEEAYAALGQHALDRGRQVVLRAPTVDQHANDSAAPRCAD